MRSRRRTADGGARRRFDDGRHGQQQSDDAIAALVRLAGRRPPVPEDAARRVREAVHDEWMEAIGRRRRTRWIGSAAVVAAAAATFVDPAVDDCVFRRSRRRNEWSLRADRRTARSFTRTMFTKSRTATPRRWRGAMRPCGSTAGRAFASRRRASSRSIAARSMSIRIVPECVIHTPIGSVRDIGTQFEVRLAADRMRVRVREGRVDLQHGGATHSAEAGVELDADARGGVTQHSIAKNGAEWEWVVRAAPPIHLDGRTLSEVVASVTRDEGLKPVWLDDAAKNAATMRLHGDVPLTPEEALDTALVASGLTSRTDGDRLIIKRRK